MGITRGYICRACGARFYASSGGGFMYDLLHCDTCGETRSVGHDELGDIHLDEWPGFDILTLGRGEDGDGERLIELKSSGIDAKTQAMTWNEWKTARDSTLRSSFYLYLVSNLRSDLGDRVPYLRAIHDPFATLWNTTTIERTSTERSVQLRLSDFALAEELPLTVMRRLGSPAGGPGGVDRDTSEGGYDEVRGKGGDDSHAPTTVSQ
jgi:hypothetical protein